MHFYLIHPNPNADPQSTPIPPPAAGLKGPLPEYPVMSPTGMVQMLRASETPHSYFRELHALCGAVLRTLRKPELAPLASALLPATMLRTKTQLTVRCVHVKRCARACVRMCACLRVHSYGACVRLRADDPPYHLCSERADSSYPWLPPLRLLTCTCPWPPQEERLADACERTMAAIEEVVALDENPDVPSTGVQAQRKGGRGEEGGSARVWVLQLSFQSAAA